MVLTDDQHDWMDGRVIAVFPEDTQAEGYDIPAGTLKVLYKLGLKWVMPDGMAAILKRRNPLKDAPIPEVRQDLLTSASLAGSAVVAVSTSTEYTACKSPSHLTSQSGWEQQAVRELERLELALYEERKKNVQIQDAFRAALAAQEEAHARDVAELEQMVRSMRQETARLRKAAEGPHRHEPQRSVSGGSTRDGDVGEEGRSPRQVVICSPEGHELIQGDDSLRTDASSDDGEGALPA